MADVPEYYRDARGYRCVRPYAHVFQAYCKARWIGRSLHSVFCAEFGAHDATYFESAIRLGCIAVNGLVQSPGYVLRDGDRIEHRLHRHEPPVPGEAFRVLSGGSPTAPFLAVCKPAGVPTHACGAHRHLAVPALLAAECGYTLGSLYTVHRLDRVTSGVLIMGRSKEEAAQLSASMRGAPGSGPVRKRYLALVSGAFPMCASPCDSGGRRRTFSEGWQEEARTALSLLDLGCVATGARAECEAQEPCPWLSAFAPHSVSLYMAGDEGEGGGAGAPAGGSGGAGLGASHASAPASAGPGGVAKAKGKAGKKRGRCEEPEVEAQPSAAAGSSLQDEHKGGSGGDGGGGCAEGAPSAAQARPVVAWTSQGYLRVDVPLRCVSYKNAVHGVAMAAGGAAAEPAKAGPGGGSASTSPGAEKDTSVTLFRCIAHCQREGSPVTLVEAIPLTGRSHQIRVHLAFLGFPIHNDPVYCAQAAAQLRGRVEAEGAPPQPPPPPLPPPPLAGEAGEGAEEGGVATAAAGSPAPGGEARAASMARVCAFCTRGGEAAEFSPMQRHVAGICLHALEYCGWAEEGAPVGAEPAWRVATPVPPWALGESLLPCASPNKGGAV
jgi:23S rRNA-/tRNA-specific pseudouridylate synthase